MKIAFIVGEFPSLSETFILNQITGLLDLGHDVEIFAQKCGFNEKTHPEVVSYNLRNKVHCFNIPPEKSKRILRAMFLIVTNICKNPLKILESLNILRYGKFALSLNLLCTVTSFLDKKFDIIFCHFGPIGNMGACLKQMRFGDRLVTMFHGADIRLGVIRGGSFYRRLFDTGDCFLAISDYNYRNLIRFGADPKKIIFHPVGIDTEKFNNPSYNIARKRKKIIILTVARIVEEKGLIYGIKAIKKVLKNDPTINLQYNIIGGGPLEIPLKNLVNKFGLTKTIHFLGPMVQKEIIKEMKKAQAFLLPSIAEALPVVLMEAQAMKLPVIATIVGGIPEVVPNKKSGYLVPVRNIDEMAKKIEYLIKNPKIRLRMGIYGRKHISKNYDINKLNLRLIKIFQNLIAK